MSNEKDAFVFGTFKEELKNRFLCSVIIGDQEEICYIPSSCRISNFINPTDKPVILKPTISKSTRTRYSLYAVKLHGRYILLNLSQPNKLIGEQLNRRYFSFLGKRKNIKTEIVIEGYKADLFVEDTNTIIEIKSIISLDRIALFPSVYSERAINQLYELYSLLQKDYNVLYLYISLNPTVKGIYIDNNMTEYKKIFNECLQKGMSSDAFAIALNNQLQPEIKKRIPLYFDSSPL